MPTRNLRPDASASLRRVATMALPAALPLAALLLAAPPLLAVGTPEEAELPATISPSPSAEPARGSALSPGPLSRSLEPTSSFSPEIFSKPTGGVTATEADGGAATEPDATDRDETQPEKTEKASVAKQGGEETATSENDGQPPGEAARQSPLRRRALTGIWWNQPRMIGALALDEAQRKKMDELLRGSVEERRRLRRRLGQAQRAFAEAAVAGDRLAAGKALEETTRATADLQRFEGSLKLAVLAHLRPEQRQQLADDFPALLHRPWIRTRVVRRGFDRRGGGPGP